MSQPTPDDRYATAMVDLMCISEILEVVGNRSEEVPGPWVVWLGRKMMDTIGEISEMKSPY